MASMPSAAEGFGWAGATIHRRARPEAAADILNGDLDGSKAAGCLGLRGRPRPVDNSFVNEPPPLPPLTPPQPAAPMYPAMLGYADGSNRPERPGLVTAMGVISILLGSLGILANLVYGLYAVLFLVFAVIGPTGALNVARGAGLGPKDRTVVLAALPQLPP